MWFDFLKRGKKEDKKKEVRYILAVAGSAMKGIYEKRRKMFNSIFALTLFVLATINFFKIFI